MRILAVAVVFAFVAAGVAGCIQTAPEDDDDGPPDPDPEPPAPVAVAWGDPATARLRPGAPIGTCTFNWLFTDANGSAYIGTAGHCTEKIGERVTYDGDEEIGTVVFDSDVVDGADTLVDFTLILIDPDQAAGAHPRMLAHDGPAGTLEASNASAGDQVAIYGYGTLFGQNEATRARVGLLLSMDEREYTADMPAVPGDSGAPILHVDTGEALGIISRFNLAEVPPTTDRGPTIGFILSELHKAGYMVDLATA